MSKNRPITLLILLCMAFILPLTAWAAQSGQVQGYVFIDENGDGLPDADEKRLEGVEVALVHSSGQAGDAAATLMTAEDGAFTFGSLPGGDYFLRFLYPSGYVSTAMSQGGSAVLPSAGQSAQTLVFSLTEGGGVTLPVGVTKRTGFVKVTAFGDSNANGGRFSTEPLLEDVLIEVVYEHNGQQYTIGSEYTDKKGEAFVRNLTPSTYRVAATVPDPYIIGPLGAKINPFYNVMVPNDTSRGLSEPLEIPAGGSVGIGASGVLTSKAQGMVWQDANMNGKKDSGETGFAGANLLLRNNETSSERSMVTDAGGAYLFERLKEGSYTLTVELPAGSMFTIAGDSIISVGDSLSGDTEFSVELGKTTDIKPIGVMPATSLTVRAFHDQNVDGLFTEGEQAFAGATVEVLSGGQVVATAVTDAEGNAVFPVLRGGALEVRCILPEGQIFTIAAENGNVFASDTAANRETTKFNLEHGTSATLLAGVTLPSAISGQLFDDANLNGIADEGEPFLSGFQVEAYSQDGVSVAAAQTNENGEYTLNNLVPSSYTVRIALTSPFIFSNPSNTGAKMENKIVSQTPGYGETALVQVNPGETVTSIDAGVFRSAIINGSVLLGDDLDNFSGALGGLENVGIELLDEEGMPVSDYTIATTDASGAFSLKGALPDTYLLRYTLPEGTAFSKPFQDESVWTSEPFTVQSSDVLQRDALYAIKTAALSGMAYTDANSDGLFNEGDATAAGVKVTLTTPYGTLEQQSDEEGLYAFAALRPGAYQAEAAIPQGNIAYAAKSLVPPALSTSSKGTMDIAMGDKLEGLDIAISPAASLQINAFYDNDLSQSFGDADAPYQFSAITLTHVNTGMTFDVVSDEKGAGSLPLAFYGAYQYEIPLPEDHIIYAPSGSQQASGVWSGTFDITQSNAILDISLVQYGSLSGAVWNLGGGTENISGVAVSLFDAVSNKQVANTVSNVQGEYAFNQLLPGQYFIKARLTPGFRYARGVDTSVRPSVIVSEGANVSGEAGQSEVFALDMGEHKTNQDIGMGATGKLGDIAWLDLDQDGMQDANEPGVPGLTIRLYQYGQLAAETTTDMYGHYLFQELYPGAYTLEVEMPAELKTTKKQTEFLLVASVFPSSQEGTARAEEVIVPSKSRNLNCDLGFALKTPGRYPANMQVLPSKDWTPLVPYTPTR